MRRPCDPYELRVVPGPGWALEAAEVSAADKAAGVRVTSKTGDGLVRVTIESAASRDVGWSLKFRQANGR